MVIAEVADAVGLFDWLGQRIARAARSARSLFGLVALAAVATTTFLSLDATAALLTPVVLRTVRRRRLDPTPFALATVQLANGSSLLLPIANLTNLLLWSATGLSFVGFATKLALPTIASTVVIVLGLGARHRVALRAPVAPDDDPPAALDRLEQAFAFGLALLLVAMAVGSALGVEVAYIAALGAVALGGSAIATHRAPLGRLAQAIAPGLLAFVAVLAVVIAIADQHGLGARVGDVIPSGSSLPALLGVAALAALLANVINNLPATLVLLVAIPHSATATLLAALLGVNIGPNLTPTGSLATLLWRRSAAREGVTVSWRELAVSGLVTTPVALAAAVGGLWLVSG